MASESDAFRPQRAKPVTFSAYSTYLCTVLRHDSKVLLKANNGGSFCEGELPKPACVRHRALMESLEVLPNFYSSYNFWHVSVKI